MQKRTALTCAAVLIANACLTIAVEGAVRYHFSTSTAGTYPRLQQGEVITDRERWRLELAPNPSEVADFDVLIGDETGRLVAVNKSLQTWFLLKSRARLAIESTLFRFGTTLNEVSDLRVQAEPISSNRELRDEGANWRLSFSYRIKVRVGSELVRGRVWGGFRIWSREMPSSMLFPWRPLDLATDLPLVDQAFSDATAKIEGFPIRVEGEVSRQLENGVTLHLTISRAISNIEDCGASTTIFQVPTNYRQEGPKIAAPGR